MEKEKIPLLVQKNNSQRNPNIDFIRIAGMFSIVVDHVVFHGQLMKKYNKYKEIRLLFILCMWHVSSFGIISGLVGNKTHKFANIFYLWILSVFYSLLFYFKYNNFHVSLDDDILISNIFPVVNNKYWYFTAYFGIYPFLPFVNYSILTLSQIQIKKSIYFMLGIFIVWSSCSKDSFSQNNGKSPFSLLIFYIIGTYIDKYIFYKKNKKYIRVIICFICSSLFVIITWITYNINIKNTSLIKLNSNLQNIFKVEINSLPMLLQTCSIIVFLSKIKFNKFTSKILSFIGPLTFDIYLIHENTYVRKNYIKNAFAQYSLDLKIQFIFFSIFKKAFLIFNISIFIAYLRSILFRILKIKNICNYLEILATKIIYYFI